MCPRTIPDLTYDSPFRHPQENEHTRRIRPPGILYRATRIQGTTWTQRPLHEIPLLRRTTPHLPTPTRQTIDNFITDRLANMFIAHITTPHLPTRRQMTNTYTYQQFRTMFPEANTHPQQHGRQTYQQMLAIQQQQTEIETTNTSKPTNTQNTSYKRKTEKQQLQHLMFDQTSIDTRRKCAKQKDKVTRRNNSTNPLQRLTIRRSQTNHYSRH